MNTGCRECDKNFIVNNKQCPKHLLDYLKWVAESAKRDYEEAKAEYEYESYMKG